jgi:hypothetical protein
MWYIAVVVMAQPKQRGRRRYLCESCNVLLSAADPGEAYRKAVAWGADYEAESIYGLKFLGVSVLNEIGETIGDGVDISGRIYEKLDVWDARSREIPPPEELQAIRLARGANTPLGELLTPNQTRLLRKGARDGSRPPRP